MVRAERHLREYDIDAEAELLKVAVKLYQSSPEEAETIKEMVELLHTRIERYQGFIRRWSKLLEMAGGKR